MTSTTAHSLHDSLLQVVAGAVTVGVMLHDRTGAIVFCNAAGEEILGLPLGRTRGRTCRTPRWRAIQEDGTSFPSDGHPAMVALRTGKSVRNVVMGVYRQDGVVAWIRVDSEPVAPQGADPIVVVTTFREIAEPRLTEELRALQSAIAPLPIGVVVGESPPGSRPRILAYNDQFRQMVGDLPAEGSEARGMTYRIFRADRQTELAPEDWPGCRAARLGEAVSDPELHVLRGDGSWRVLTVSAAPVKTGSDNQGYCAVEVALDITEHRPAQVDPGTHAGRRSACRRRGHGRSRSAP